MYNRTVRVACFVCFYVSVGVSESIVAFDEGEFLSVTVLIVGSYSLV